MTIKYYIKGKLFGTRIIVDDEKFFALWLFSEDAHPTLSQTDKTKSFEHSRAFEITSNVQYALLKSDEGRRGLAIRIQDMRLI